MTDAPERIWARPSHSETTNEDMVAWGSPSGADEMEYILRSASDRQTQEAVAAALMEAADKMARHTAEDDPVLLQKTIDDFEEKDGRSDHSRQYRAHLIRALIPADALPALTRRLAEARAEGLEEAATLVPDKKWWQGGEVAVGLDRLEHVIRARAAEVRGKNVSDCLDK